MAGKVELLSKAEKDKLLKDLAHQVVKDISIKSYEVMNEFYGDYTPRYYQRTWGLKNPFHVEMQKTAKGYRVTFDYSVAYLTSSHRSDEDAFQGSFVEGWHGGPLAWGGKPRKEDPKLSPSPWERIVQYCDSKYMH